MIWFQGGRPQVQLVLASLVLGTCTSNLWMPIRSLWRTIWSYSEQISRRISKNLHNTATIQKATSYPILSFRTWSNLVSVLCRPLRRNQKYIFPCQNTVDQLFFWFLLYSNCILTWKDIFVFPVFDLFVLFANSESFSAIIEKNLTWILYRIEQLAESSSGATKTMALRFLANFSGSRKGCEMLTRETVLYGLVGIFRQCEDRSVTLALCTLMLNLCVFAYNERCEIKFMALVPVLVGILSRSTENIDEESCFRALVAVGTICWQSDELLESFKQRNIVSLVDSAKNIKSPKVENCCSHLKFLLEKDFWSLWLYSEC